MSNETIFFTCFITGIVSILILDLGVFSKESRTISFKEAAMWSGLWVLCALAFYSFIDIYGHWIHGINDFEHLKEIVAKYHEHVVIDPNNFELSLDNYRHNQAMEFITGYLVEYALSVDNIFIMMTIFTSFKVREKYYKKVLFWGILGAIVMRFIFIFIGAALISKFDWVLYVFGVLLVVTGAKMIFSKEEDSEMETEKHPIVKICSKIFPVFPKYFKDNFFIRQAGKLMITPLFVVLIIVEFTDLLFAIDSVPAVFSVTKDPYLVFFSNIFAILGLRSMFFFLSNILHLFHFLKYGLAVLLVFIGGKMLIHTQLHQLGFHTSHSLYVILAILATSVIASLVFPQAKKVEEKNISEKDLT